MGDFNLNQWRNQSEQQREEEDQQTPTKLPKLSSALPLFLPDKPHSTSAMAVSYFSLAQWQELEVQALIFRYMISGAAVPHELLHLVKKSLLTSSSSSSSYYFCNPLHHYYSQYQPPLLQSGYWSKASVDPEPGRCRRTDGKKWRCSRDVVAGQKYCERHMHRGRNRSRKPVEIATSTTGAAVYGGDGGGDAVKSDHSAALSYRRPLDSTSETKYPVEDRNNGQTNGDRTLRHFFNDWPKSLQESDNATDLSISMPENPSSDFSLKLGTGTGNEFRAQEASNGVTVRPQPNWSTPWETNRVTPMGGPLAEALRSSTTTSSPTSVLHRLTRSSASEASFVTS